MGSRWPQSRRKDERGPKSHRERPEGKRAEESRDPSTLDKRAHRSAATSMPWTERARIARRPDGRRLASTRARACARGTWYLLETFFMNRPYATATKAMAGTTASITSESFHDSKKMSTIPMSCARSDERLKTRACMRARQRLRSHRNANAQTRRCVSMLDTFA
eukprot:6214141-Pleurochrysis_carterae.AAC.3